jgi:hypothetical protein
VALAAVLVNDREKVLVVVAGLEDISESRRDGDERLWESADE